MKLLRLSWSLWLVITILLLLVTSSEETGAATEECPWSKFSHELDLWKPDDDDLWTDEAPPDFSQVKIVSLRSSPSTSPGTTAPAVPPTKTTPKSETPNAEKPAQAPLAGRADSPRPPSRVVRPLLPDPTRPDEQAWMRDWDIVPRVLKKSPRELNSLWMNINGRDVDVSGCPLTADQVHEPGAGWAHTKGVYYTQLILDITSPTNLFRNHLENVNFDGKTSDKLRHFVHPSKFPEIEGHVFLYLTYEQPKKVQVEAKDWKSEDELPTFDFNLDAFVKRYDLGEPVAGSAFMVKIPDSHEKPCDFTKPG